MRTKLSPSNQVGCNAFLLEHLQGQRWCLLSQHYWSQLPERSRNFLPQALPVVPLQPRTVVNPLIVPQSVGVYPGGRSAVSPFLPRRGAACAVSGFQMQNNFDLRSFMGQWYAQNFKINENMKSILTPIISH